MMRFIAGIGLAVLLTASHAYAGDVQDCNQRTDLVRQINGCTQLLRKHPKNPKNGLAYSKRGIAYFDSGDYDRAIADFNSGLALDPNDAKDYHNRGVAFSRKGDYDRAIADFDRSLELDSKLVQNYRSRATAYAKKGDYDSALADYAKSLVLDPGNGGVYYNRGYTYLSKGDYDRAIADFDRSLELDSKLVANYSSRGVAYNGKGDYDRAIADLNKAIEIDSKHPIAYHNRGDTYLAKGDTARALADYTKAIEIDPRQASPHLGMGKVLIRKGDYDRAIAELSEAMRLDGKDPEPVAARGEAYEAKGQSDKALADYRAALDLPARSPTEKESHTQARRRIAEIERRAQPAAATAATTTTDPSTPPDNSKPATPPGRRVALVIANSNYGSVSRLTNPANDGRAIAASLRRLAFAEVSERYDLDHSAMRAALKEFGDQAVGAEWAVVYYAGHGIEMNGDAYLIPVDAKLERDSHVSDETVPLGRVLEKVESAQKLRLVILDACRNNPFVARMIRGSGTRSIGRGLAQIEPESGVLVAYAAKHGTTADDGAGDNSPFAEALLANLEQPGLEINFLFRKVRDQVLAKTGKRQEPYLYGSLPSETLYFRQAEAR